MSVKTVFTLFVAAALIVAFVAGLSLFKIDNQPLSQMQEADVGDASLSGEEATGAGYVIPPNIAVSEPPEQPLPYSHRIHAGTLGLACTTCHAGAPADDAPDPSDGGRLMTFPKTAVCMECHREIAMDSPAVARLVDYFTANQAIPWKRVYETLPGVSWSHQPHLESGVLCETCHGDVRELDVMAQTTAVVAMATCIGCHQAKGAPTTCQTCHAWPPAQRYSERKE